MRCGLRDVGVLFESISLDEAQNARGGSVVPPGLYSFLPLFPALKRWAKLGRPPGLTSVAVPESEGWKSSPSTGRYPVKAIPPMTSSLRLISATIDPQVLWYEETAPDRVQRGVRRRICIDGGIVTKCPTDSKVT